MATSDLLNERHITNARVYIEGDEIDFVSLSLEQSFSEHHSFRVVMDYDTLKQDFMKNPLEQMKLIGQFLDIDLMQGDDSGNAYEFRGVIRDVYHEGQEGKHGYLILEGLSPTILLERGKRLDIFCNMNLGQVFDQVTDNIINKKDRLPCVNKPHYTGQVNFLMQYKESDWEFLRRLSAISGETLLYTGMDLVFGEYKDWSPVEVTYDKEITSFQFGTRLLANNFTRYQYLAEQDDTITQDAPATIDNANEYVNTAADSSKELTEKRPVRTPSSLPIGDIGSLNELVAREKSVTASETVYVRGTAKTCAPRIGRQLTINMPANMGGASDLGTYRIVKVKHTIDQNHRYKCEFEAVPAALKTVPAPEVCLPVADSIRATVISNEDPQGQGRIRVDFPFAQDRVSDVWLRVMTPNAGSSDVVQKNRGLVFVPEKGDQVMVGFEFGDPNQPYVMGSMFHGKNAEGGKEDNHIKSIITRQGHTIEFDDAEDTLGITIKDKNGNFVHIDTKGNNIEITALETMTLNAKNINMYARENISGYAGENINMHADRNMGYIAGEDCQTSANNIYTQAISDSMHTAKKYDVIADKARIDSTQENLELASNKEVDVQSAKKVRLF
ncbi:type VI secretion system secreted protein VgrG [Dysgonomonas sp. PFB1-18]|uniref:phage baseplate assembly protein V n=1 Tax=unclassified Dysgonomonas TaxID=2630389 RepID=UPI0024751BA2|nr:MULTISPECIES: phage baseplate assembly protein V [unclassified Dysgonomonas]MDH6309472.1 type VI secretion system secreted protein VgrG [Dysgonomonas sp. PF1-14]MDH6340882.1 type VI secretion system secreted protein VgrG [Dysgonomonas sp. PF1-16]MDH6382505.1 type VI secretion system secreted protein VgrG [Dysgonomonas sp. PFB1-18]MDH6399851.1 type VI secretion system secreted protein VgrG [Dysgonomonas sp. PF1-23]